jgi:hypothetical protein
VIRTFVLGRLDRDLACAIALNWVEAPHVAVTPEAITLHDAQMRSLGTEYNWLRGDDPLDQATRNYLSARREASTASIRRPGETAWGAAAAIKKRDGANSRARQARDLGRSLLAERGVLVRAQKAGLRVLNLD